jgi:hypothetical protein
VHFHVIIRLDGPDGPKSPPPEWLNAKLMLEVVTELVSDVVLGPDADCALRWGSQFKVHEVDSSTDEVLKVASYIAKYSTKSTAGSEQLARGFASRSEISRATISEHHRRLALAAWDLERSERSPRSRASSAIPTSR